MTPNIKDLISRGIIIIAALPEKNYTDIDDIQRLSGYTIPLIAHDYSAKTPLMWNMVYEKLGLNIRNIMMVADPKDLKEITYTFRNDPKYLGGGAGVGFKEKIIPYLDEIRPKDLASVNIVVKENGKLIGYNTDSKGLYMSLEDALLKENKKINNGKFLIFGAGGVAKEFVRQLAENKAERIVIANRTYGKAVALANELNVLYHKDISYGVPEDLIRGTMLNTIKKLDGIINCTDKGSDGPLIDTSAFAPAGEYNNTLSIENLRLLNDFNPNVVIVDIVLPKTGRSVTLRHADSIANGVRRGFKNLVDGLPMVINQAAPAYKLVESAYPNFHSKTLSEKELLEYMRVAVKKIEK